jgi:hypothetical protein
LVVGLAKAHSARGVLEQAADGVHAQVAQAGVAVAGQQGRLALPEREVRVQARAVVAVERLGHERGGLVGQAGDVADDVAGEHRRVSRLDQGPAVEVDLALAAGGDLVVMRNRTQAAVVHPLDHLGPEVGQAVGRRRGEVTEARAGFISEVGTLDPAPVPGAFDGVDVVIRLVAALVEPDVVEDEELQLGGNSALVGDAGRAHVRDGLACDIPRVAGVILLSDRVLDVADHRQRRPLRERVDQGRLGLGDDEQVGLVDRPPADDARSVEPDSLLERLLGEGLGRYSEMLPDAREVHEPEVDRRDLALSDLRQNLFR